MSISDEDRKHLEESLIAALLILYEEQSQEQYDALGADAAPISDDAKQKIAEMAAETALLIQQGINTRLADAGSGDNPSIEDVQQEIQDYNQNTLMPYLISWVTHQATVDVYDGVPNPDNPDQSMRDAVLWTWERHTDWIYDDCQAAEDASPASYDALIGIGGEIPSHRNCLCTLTPVTG